MRNSNVIGIDLAKDVIQVCKIDKHGELISNKAISPSKLKELLAKTAPVNCCDGRLWCLSLLVKAGTKTGARCASH